MGVVVRRYIDFLILLIPTPLVSVLLQQHPYLKKKCFLFFTISTGRNPWEFPIDHDLLEHMAIII